MDPDWNYIGKAFSYAEETPLMATDAEGRQASLGLSDRKCLVCTIYAEARGTGRACQRAVGDVILNRLDAGDGNNICDVVLHSKFGPFDGARWDKPNFRRCVDCFAPKNKPEDEFIPTFGNIPPIESWGPRLPVFFFCTVGAAGARCIGTRESEERKRIEIPDCKRLVFFSR